MLIFDYACITTYDDRHKKHGDKPMETLEDFGLPRKQLFFKLSEIKEIGLMSIERAKQLLYKGELEGVKNGKMWVIPRAELLRIINENYTGNQT